MISTGRLRLALLALFWLSAATSTAVRAQAAPAPANDVTLFRVFLQDGTTLVSYGEFARVADTVVLTLPLQTDPPKLQLVSIPAATVDWEKTDAYAESARAARYAATRGPDDYALLGGAVSRALTDISLTPDPQRKTAMAIEARRNVTKWLADHYGYRAADVAKMASLFDDVVSEARKAAGQPNFDLSLVASMAVPPSVPLLPSPDTKETLEDGYSAAMMTTDPAQRTSLLRAIRDSLKDRDAPDLTLLGARVDAALATEERIDRSYQSLTARTLRTANAYAARANVRALTRLAGRVLDSDDKLGHKRPAEMASLLAALDAKLDAARRLRLARDQWAARQPVLQAYRQAIAEPTAALRLSHEALDAIQQMAGPSLAVLRRASTRLTHAERLLEVVKAPPEMESAHAFLVGAMQLANRAVSGRQRAVRTGTMQTARDASSAAAGALLLFARAVEALQQVSKVPQLK